MASVVKTYEIHILTERGDITWNFVDFVIWAALEINIVIIAASIPTLSPIFKKRKAQTSSYYPYDGTGPTAASRRSDAWKATAQRSTPSQNHERSGRVAAPFSRSRSTTSEEEILGKDGRIQMTYELDVASHHVSPNHHLSKSELNGW